MRWHVEHLRVASPSRFFLLLLWFFVRFFFCSLSNSSISLTRTCVFSLLQLLHFELSWELVLYLLHLDFFFSNFCVFAHCREVFTAVSGYISLSMQQLHESISRYVCECQQRKMNMRTNYQLTEYNAIYGKNAFSIFNFLRWRFPLRFSLASFSPHSSCPRERTGSRFLCRWVCVLSAWVSFTFDSSFNRTTCCAADAECSFLYFMYYIYYDDDFFMFAFFSLSNVHKFSFFHTS